MLRGFPCACVLVCVCVQVHVCVKILVVLTFSGGSILCFCGYVGCIIIHDVRLTGMEFRIFFVFSFQFVDKLFDILNISFVKTYSKWKNLSTFK